MNVPQEQLFRVPATAPELTLTPSRFSIVTLSSQRRTALPVDCGPMAYEGAVGRNAGQDVPSPPVPTGKAVFLWWSCR